MANRYTIPGFFEDVEVVNGTIKKPGFAGKTLGVIKGTEIREPGILGKTILIIKDGVIKKPGFLGKTLFYIDENGAIKEPKIFGRTVGAFPVYPGMGPKRHERSTGDKPSASSNEKPSAFQRQRPVSEPHEETLAEFEEKLDLASGYSADYTNCKPEAKKITVPAKYKIFTSIAPALKSVETVVIHAGVTGINQASIHCLKEYIVDENNPKFVSIGGVIYDKDVTTVVAVPSELDMSTFRFPETVKRFLPGAFHVLFDSFFIQKNIQDPGDVSVKKHFEIEEGSQHLKIVDGVLYSSDGKTLYSAPRRTKLGRLQIPEGVEVIRKNALSEVRADSAVLPRSLRVIMDGAFSGSRLTKIFIPDTVETIGKWAFIWIKGLTIECQAKEKGRNWADEWVERALDAYKPTILFGVASPDF